MNKKKLQVLQNFINIEYRSNNIHSNLYKKKSAKIYLLFFHFFNSIICLNKFLIKLNLNLTYFIKTFENNVKSINNVSFVDFFFINTNFNIFTYKKNTKKKLIKYYRIFTSQFRRYVSNIFRKTCNMILKNNFIKRLKLLFINLIYINLKTINFNNIYLYCSEIFKCVFYYLYRINLIYFIKLNQINKFFNNILFYQKNHLKKFIYNITKYNKKLNIKIILKFFKMFSNLIYNNKVFIKKEFFNLAYQEYFDSISYIKNKYVKKYIYIFDIYTNCNIKIKTYWNFSFVLKKKKKKKQNKDDLQKKINFFYIINTIINKYIYFIFIHWVNLFFIECTSQLNFDDKLFIKNKNKLPIFTVFNLYYEKKKYSLRGATMWKAPKLCYLVYYKPSKFLLYFNKGLNQNKYHENS